MICIALCWGMKVRREMMISLSGNAKLICSYILIACVTRTEKLEFVLAYPCLRFGFWNYLHMFLCACSLCILCTIWNIRFLYLIDHHLPGDSCVDLVTTSVFWWKQALLVASMKKQSISEHFFICIPISFFIALSKCKTLSLTLITFSSD